MHISKQYKTLLGPDVIRIQLQKSMFVSILRNFTRVTTYCMVYRSISKYDLKYFNF